MDKNMENLEGKGRLSKRLSSRKKLGSLKARFRKFVSDQYAKAELNSTTSGSDTAEKKISSPRRAKKNKKSSSSSSSSDSEEGSPSIMTEKGKKKSDSSSDSSSRKKKKKAPSKSRRKKLQSLLSFRQERKEASVLPPLDETPSSSPLSNPRRSSGAQSDFLGRLWKSPSNPTSPADLAHNVNLYYRGGDSSPVGLVHSLSLRESGKHTSQLSEISIASPPRSSSLDHDGLGGILGGHSTPPSKTTSLRQKRLPSAYHDEEQGVWKCRRCGWIYPKPNPSPQHRREHKQHCGEISNVQLWLGAGEESGEGVQDPAEEVVEDLQGGDVEALEGSSIDEMSAMANEYPMATIESEDGHEDMSPESSDHPGAVEHGRLDETESNWSTDHHEVEDQRSVGEGKSDGSPDHHEVEKQSKLESPSNGSADLEDQSPLERVFSGSNSPPEVQDKGELESAPNESTDNLDMDQREVGTLSSGSTNHQETEDHSKLESVSSDHHGDEDHSKEDYLVGTGLDTKRDSEPSPDIENEKEDSAQTKDMTLETAPDEVEAPDGEAPQVLGGEVEGRESQLTQKPEAGKEEEVEDVQLEGDGNPVHSGEQSNAVVDEPSEVNGHKPVRADSTESFQEVEEENGSGAAQGAGEHFVNDLGLTDVDQPELHTNEGKSGTENGNAYGQGTDSDMKEMQSLPVPSEVDQPEPGNEQDQEPSLDKLHSLASSDEAEEEPGAEQGIAPAMDDLQVLANKDDIQEDELGDEQGRDSDKEGLQDWQVLPNQDEAEKEDPSEEPVLANKDDVHEDELGDEQGRDADREELQVLANQEEVEKEEPSEERVQANEDDVHEDELGDEQGRDGDTKELQVLANQDEAEKDEPSEEQGIPFDIGDTQELDDDGPSEKPRAVEVEKMEPGVTADDDALNGKARVGQEVEGIQPIGQDDKGQVNNDSPVALDDAGHKDTKNNEHENVETAEEMTKSEASKPTTPLVQSGHLNDSGAESDSEIEQQKSSTISEPEGLIEDLDSTEVLPLPAENSEVDSLKERSVEGAPPLENHSEIKKEEKDREGTKLHSAEGKLVGASSNTLEDHLGTETVEDLKHQESMMPLLQTPLPQQAARQVGNDMIVTSEHDIDGSDTMTFSSMQKYWADMARSDYLIFEGKRSPSSMTTDEAGFPSLRHVEGRMSPSPLPPSQSEGREINGSFPPASSTYQSRIDGRHGDGEITSEAHVHPGASSSSSAPVEYNFAQCVREQNTHDLMCPVCGSCITKRVILRKRKRTRVPEVDTRPVKAREDKRPGPEQEQDPPLADVADGDDETWGCLACLSFFIRLGGGAKKTQAADELTASGEPVEEKERVRCLPLLFPPFRWGPATAEPDLLEPLLQEPATQEAVADLPESPAEIVGPIIHEVPVDDKEQVSCFSYLQRAKKQHPPGGTSPPEPEASPSEAECLVDDPVDGSIKDSVTPVSGPETSNEAELPTHTTVTNVREAEDCQCLPGLFPKFSWGTSVSETVGEMGPTAQLPASNVQEETREKGKESIQQLGETGVPVDELPNQEEVSETGTTLDVREEEEKASINCLPFWSFGHSESSLLVRPGTDATSTVTALPTPDFSGGLDESGDSLPESVPAFPSGTPSPTYHLPPSILPEQEITKPDEDASIGPADSSTAVAIEQPPVKLTAEDLQEEKATINCLPLFRSRFSKISSAVETETDVNAAAQRLEEITAGSASASTTGAAGDVEEPQEKESFNCLPDLQPDLSWGTSFPKYDLPPEMPWLDDRQRGSLPPKVSSPGASVDVEESTEQESFNCLPDLQPAFSWGTSFPKYGLPPEMPWLDDRQSLPPKVADVVDKSREKGKGIVDEGENVIVGAEKKPEKVVRPEATPDVQGKLPTEAKERPKGHEEITAGSASASTTGAAGDVEEPQEKESCNCLPDLQPPVLSWGTSFPKYDLPPETPWLDYRQRESLPPKVANVVDPSREKGKRIISESEKPPGLETHDDDQSTTADAHEKLPTEDKERAGFNCLPLLLPAVSWGFLDTTRHEKTSAGLQKPRPHQGPDDADMETLQVGPVPSDVPTEIEQPSEPVSSAAEQPPSSSEQGQLTHTIRSDEVHITGEVTAGSTTTTMTRPSEDADEVMDSRVVDESKFRFQTDIKDGHITHTVEGVRPKPPLESQMSSGYAKLSPDYRPTQLEPQITTADVIDGLTQPDVESSKRAERDGKSSEDELMKRIARAMAAHGPAEHAIATPELRPQPGEAIMGSMFPVSEIDEATEAPEEKPPLLEEKDIGNEIEGVSCNCLPLNISASRWWSLSRDNMAEGGVKEPLLEQSKETQQAGERPAVVVPKKTHPDENKVEQWERCNCLPFSFYHLVKDDHIMPVQVDDVRTPLLGSRDETAITIQGGTSEVAPRRGVRSTQWKTFEILKSIEHGGLDVTLVSLALVSSMAGADAETITVFAVGLANLAPWVYTYFSTILYLYYNNPEQFQEQVGQSWQVNGSLALISFLVFGALAPITYGFSFRHAMNRDYKFLATCAVALVCIGLLGSARAHVRSRSRVKVLSKLVGGGFVAAIAGYGAGNGVLRVLQQFGFGNA